MLIKLKEKRDKSQHELENAQVALNEVVNLEEESSCRTPCGFM